MNGINKWYMKFRCLKDIDGLIVSNVVLPSGSKVDGFVPVAAVIVSVWCRNVFWKSTECSSLIKHLWWVGRLISCRNCPNYRVAIGSFECTTLLTSAPIHKNCKTHLHWTRFCVYVSCPFYYLSALCWVMLCLLFGMEVEVGTNNSKIGYFSIISLREIDFSQQQQLNFLFSVSKIKSEWKFPFRSYESQILRFPLRVECSFWIGTPKRLLYVNITHRICQNLPCIQQQQIFFSRNTHS